jgi:transcriptional regulator with XRE-family HTH domain
MLSLTEENRKKIDAQQVRKVVEKSMAGGILTKREEEILDRATETLPEEGTSVAKYAKNQTDLASAIGVDRKTIQRWRKDSSFPKPKADGRYDITEVIRWKEYNNTRGGDLVSKESEQIKSLVLANEKLELQLSILKGEYTKNSVIEDEMVRVVTEVKRQMMSMPSSLAPIVIGQTLPEAERIIKEAVLETLKSLSDTNFNE